MDRQPRRFVRGEPRYSPRSQRPPDGVLGRIRCRAIGAVLTVLEHRHDYRFRVGVGDDGRGCFDVRHNGRDVSQVGPTSRDRYWITPLTTDNRKRLRELEKENRELRRANEISKDALILFAPRARRSNEEVVRYIEARRDRWGVEPIHKVLQSARATHCAARFRPRSQRRRRDEDPKVVKATTFLRAEFLRWRALRRRPGAIRVSPCGSAVLHYCNYRSSTAS